MQPAETSGMTFLVASHSFLIAVELDAAWQVRNHYVINEGHHYGLALFDDAAKILAKRPHSAGQEVLLFASEPPFAEIGAHQFERIGASHQMTYANGGIYIANTSYNSLVYERFDDGKRHEHFFFGIDQDRNHVNSVFPCGEQIYVLLHNGLRYTTSQVAVLHHDLERGFTLEALLSLWHTGCHNVFVEDGWLFYNSSQTGELVVVNLKTQRIEQRLTFKGHTKGLSVTDDYIALGVAEYAERDQRKSTNGYLAVLDRTTLERIAWVDLNFADLPHGIGNINEVRCLSHSERAQAGHAPLDIDWPQMKLAKSEPLHYAAARGRIFTWAAGKAVNRILRNGRQAALEFGE